MQKVVVNRCWGGFGLSYKAIMLYAKLSGFKLYASVDDRSVSRKSISNWKYRPYRPGEDDEFLIYYSTKPLNSDGKHEEDAYWSDRDLKRDDPILIQVVEKLGKKANGLYAELRITEIPNGVKWVIDDYDGMETVEEEHRSW